MRALRRENEAQYQELVKARAEAFQLGEKLKLLREEVAQSRLQVDTLHNKVKFNSSAARSRKRKKIKQLLTNAANNLPPEIRVVEVSSLGTTLITYPLVLFSLSSSHSFIH